MREATQLATYRAGSADARARANASGRQVRARNAERVKRDGWRDQGLLAVALDDDRLTWPERELVRQLGEKLYGKREESANA